MTMLRDNLVNNNFFHLSKRTLRHKHETSVKEETNSHHTFKQNYIVIEWLCHEHQWMSIEYMCFNSPMNTDE